MHPFGALMLAIVAAIIGVIVLDAYGVISVGDKPEPLPLETRELPEGPMPVSP